MRPNKFRYVYKDLDGGIVMYYFTLKQIESWNVWETLDCCWSHSYELLSIDQSIWILDKNSKEIYEHDIVRLEDLFWGVYRDESYLGYFIVNWKSNEPMYSYPNYEVIWNIYETPELLNQG